ncbi:MAG: hypothetical protein K2W82_05675 [Candidatus Obscuribacterales bacterium]|nr:hypothetical protein [Candidatus Obscuribacterales bacterium]
MNNQDKDDLISLKANLHLALVANSSEEAPSTNDTAPETDESADETASCQNGVCVLAWRPRRLAS